MDSHKVQFSYKSRCSRSVAKSVHTASQQQLKRSAGLLCPCPGWLLLPWREVKQVTTWWHFNQSERSNSASSVEWEQGVLFPIHSAHLFIANISLKFKFPVSTGSMKVCKSLRKERLPSLVNYYPGLRGQDIVTSFSQLSEFAVAKKSHYIIIQRFIIS